MESKLALREMMHIYNAISNDFRRVSDLACKANELQLMREATVLSKEIAYKSSRIEELLNESTAT